MALTLVSFRRASVAAALSLLLAVPFASIGAGSTARAAGTDGVTTVAVGDPDATSEPRIALSGSLLVVAGEPAASDGSSAVEEHDHDLYAVQTAEGTLVPVTAEFPETARTGDEFSGSVVVPSQIVDSLETAVADELRATVDAPALEESADGTQKALAAALAGEETLEVASAEVVSPSLEAAAAGTTHSLQVVVVNPAGTAAVTYSDSEVSAIAAASGSFWASSSNGVIPSFAQTGAITRMATTTTCAQSPLDRWADVLEKLGQNAGYYTGGNARHLVVLLPAGCNTAQGPGIGSVGNSVHQGGLTQITVGLGVDKQTVIHELGHNMSLSHSNLDVCSADAVTVGCTEHEYADAYDVMGVGIQSFDSPLALNTRNQLALGFISQSQVSRLALATSETTRTFSVTVGALSGTLASRFLDVVDPDTGQVLTIDYRRGDAGAFYARNPTLTFGSDQVELGAGVRLLRASSSNGTTVLTSPPVAPTTVTQSSSTTGETVTNSSGTVRVTVTGMSTASATISVALTRTSTTPSQPVYRFWSAANSTHFYTTSAAERDLIIRTYPTSQWEFEGERYRAFTTQVAGTVPLYRFWSPSMKGHFFTASEAEKDYVIADFDDSVWTFEGVAYYVYPTDTTVPSTKLVSRFWSPDNRHHFYTADASERDIVINNYPDNVWTYEGPRFRVPLK
jgi:hypothetical protein